MKENRILGKILQNDLEVIFVCESVPTRSLDNTVAVLSTGNISIDISESASEEFLVKLMRAMRYAG